MIYFDNDNTSGSNFSKSNIDIRNKRKRELLKQAVKRNHVATQSVATHVSHNTDEVKRLRRENNNLKKKLESANAKNTKLVRSNTSDQQVSYRLKKQNKDLRVALAQEKQNSTLLIKQKQDLLNQLDVDNAKNKQLTDWLTANNIDSFRALKALTDKSVKQVELISLLFQMQVENNRALFRDLMDVKKEKQKLNKRVDAQTTEIKAINHTNGELGREISWQKRKNDDIKNSYERRLVLQSTAPNDLIDLLINQCSARNFILYDNLDKLIAKYDEVLDELLGTNQEQYRYGYLKHDDNSMWVLRDVNVNADVPVMISEKLLFDSHLIDGATARVRWFGGQWLVEKIYKHNNYHRKMPAKRKKNVSAIRAVNDHKIVLTDADELAWLKDKNVLVLGNKFSDGFLRETRKYVNVTVLDAYEDGMHQIFGAMEHADYIFLLIGSVPHAVTEYMKGQPDLAEGSSKVQVFDTPAKYDGVIRLHYLYANAY